MKKKVKAYVIVGKGGNIVLTAPDGWNFHDAIFTSKSRAKKEMIVCTTLIPCTITYEIPKKKSL